MNAKPMGSVDADVRLFKALGDATRLRIMALLVGGELCVCSIEEALGVTQTMTSRHLGVLRNAGLVAARRDGQWMYYRLNLDSRREELLAGYLASLRKELRYTRVRCSTAACAN